jgi:2-polyprenyl-3-methyl-5-hydroxy-6-metoxy-1,4-benzoquinol methylase
MVEISSYYESYFKDFANDLTPEQFDIHASRYAHNCDRFLRDLPRDSRILDVGCGVGQFLYYCQKAGFRNLEGIDMNEGQLQCARQMLPDAHLQLAMTTDYLPSRPKSYDVIVMNDVIEHIPRQVLNTVLVEIRDALKPGGFFLIKTPNMANPLCLNVRYKDFTHEAGFTETSLKQVLGEAGYADIQQFMEEAPVTSWRAKVRKKIFLGFGHRLLRFLFYCFEITPVPKILTQWIIVTARPAPEKS